MEQNRFKLKLNVLLQITFLYIESEVLNENITIKKSTEYIPEPSEIIIILVILGIWVYSIGRYWKYI